MRGKPCKMRLRSEQPFFFKNLWIDRSLRSVPDGGGGMLENRRKYMRVPIQADVACTVGSRTLRGVSWNLSQGGMQVEVGGLKPKDAVRLSFQLPVSAATIDAAGIVVWGNEQRQGIQFTNVSAQSQQSIRQFIADVEKMES